ncbi:MAG: flavodoxin family protein, partial [Draconibacterium sp.]
PTWGMRLPPPMKTFLTKYDLSGKTVVPFNTNAGYGLGSSLETVEELCSNSSITEAFTVRGGIERDGILFVMEGEKATQVNEQVKSWLQRIGF